MKTERLYLKAWTYNAYRILSALAEIVENNGGEIVHHSWDKEYLITNRGVTAVIEEKKSRIETAKQCGKKWKGQDVSEMERDLNDYIEKYGREAEEPIKCTHSTYIDFIYDGIYYEYHVDNNPFFEFHYGKYPMENGKYDCNRYSENDKKEWLYDCFFHAGCSEADIKEAANLIFNMLIKAAHSGLVREKKRIQNTYDNRYHYEYFHEKRMKEPGKF